VAGGDHRGAAAGRPTISVVTAWLEHHELAEDYIAALEAGPWPDELIIIDNGNAPEIPGAKVLTPGCNLGFAKASNLGLEHATCDAVLFLNNDIALRDAGWLDAIRAALEPGVLVGRLRESLFSSVDGMAMPYIDGWCLAGMRDDLLALGGFDETLDEPAYLSDNLLCLEARAAGLTLREATVGLRHKESATSRPSVNPEVWRVTIANQVRYQARARELLTTA
jgi:GT2 family glycosyltransferase